MLLNKYLQKYHFNEIHSIKIDADTESIMEAIEILEVREISRIMSVLMNIRTLPKRIKGKSEDIDKNIRLLDYMYKNKFYMLEENENELVIGLIGN